MMPLTDLVDYLGGYVYIQCEHEANVGDEPRREEFRGEMTEVRSNGIVVGGIFVANKIIVGISRI